MLKDIAKVAREATGTSTLHELDYLDDGSPIELTVGGAMPSFAWSSPLKMPCALGGDR